LEEREVVFDLGWLHARPLHQQGGAWTRWCVAHLDHHLLEILDRQLAAQYAEGLLARPVQRGPAGLTVGLSLPEAQDAEDTAVAVSTGREAPVALLGTDDRHGFLPQEDHTVVDVLRPAEGHDTGMHEHSSFQPSPNARWLPVAKSPTTGRSSRRTCDGPPSPPHRCDQDAGGEGDRSAVEQLHTRELGTDDRHRAMRRPAAR